MDIEPRGLIEQVDLKRPTYERGLGPVLKIEGDQISASKWEKMLELTQADGRERGIIVSSVFGKVRAGNVFEGTGENGRISASTTPPIIDGLRDILGRRMALIHTHPMTDEISHLSTTILTDADIQSFYQSTYNAILAIDRGGAHLLVKTRRPYEESQLPENIVKKRLKEIIRINGEIANAILLVALDLERYGLAYYFCSDTSSRSRAKIFYLAKRYFSPTSSGVVPTVKNQEEQGQ